MSQKVITIRGRTFSVESKSGNQLAFIRQQFEKRSDAQLDGYAAEYAADCSSPDDISGSNVADLNAVLADIGKRTLS